MMATAKQLREEIAALRSVGSLMSNVCFNLGQGQKEFDRQLMDDLRKQWDAIPRSEPCKS